MWRKNQTRTIWILISFMLGETIQLQNNDTDIYSQIVMESLMINFMISACILFVNSVLSFSSFVCIIWLRQLFFDFLLSVVLWNWICLSHTGEMQYFHCISIHKMNIMQWNLPYHLMACILINLNATLWNKNHKTNSL